MRDIKCRQDLADVMLEILEPLKPFYSPKKAFLRLGANSAHYPDRAAWMEGFSRPLWGLGAFFAGGSDNEEWEEIYIKGLVSGSNPTSDEYWGDCVPYDQKLVEMAAISFAILWNKEKFLSKMTEEEQDNLFNWLSQINKNPCHSCNWKFFHVLVNVLLKKIGREYDVKGMEESLEALESYYVEDGWYIDGTNGEADYYIPFAMHFYGLIYAIFMREDDSDRCQRFIDRAMLFGKNFIYWFDENGSAIPYGRSQTYRFAQGSFYSACVMAHIEPIPLAQMKGIIVRHLDYWLSRPIFDNAGILTVGYEYPNIGMSESYNAPGSPYWAMKIFACLCLTKEDEFWSIEQEKLPQMDELKCFPEGRHLIQRTKEGHAVLFPEGLHSGHIHTHMEEKYSKFAYSSKYGFSVMRSQYNFYEAAPDSTLAFELENQIFVRRTIDRATTYQDKIISEWSPFIGIRVHTEIIPTIDGHIRIHEINSEYDCIAYDSGFSVEIGDNSCEVSSLEGDGEKIVMGLDPNTNVMHPKTELPTVRYRIKKGINIIKTKVQY